MQPMVISSKNEPGDCAADPDAEGIVEVAREGLREDQQGIDQGRPKLILL